MDESDSELDALLANLAPKPGEMEELLAQLGSDPSLEQAMEALAETDVNLSDLLDTLPVVPERQARVPDATVGQVAEWMAAEVHELGRLHQGRAARTILVTFGEEHVYRNRNRNLVHLS